MTVFGANATSVADSAMAQVAPKPPSTTALSRLENRTFAGQPRATAKEGWYPQPIRERHVSVDELPAFYKAVTGFHPARHRITSSCCYGPD
jgi:hypothetical protein